MSQKNWKLLFQEKALFLCLLESESGKLTRPEALALVQGEGRRLDDLVREGWILVLEEEIFPGAGLMVADGFHANSLIEVRQMWEMSKGQLEEAILQMTTSETLRLREQIGGLVFKRMVMLRAWAFLLHSAILEEDQGEGEKIAEEFKSLAENLRSVTLRSSGFPEWETTQWQLIEQLEARAAYLRMSNGDGDTDRLQKLKVFSRLGKEGILHRTNLESILKSEDFLLLHKKLGIVSWPFFPSNPENLHNAVTDIQIDTKEALLEDMIAGWRESGLDLLTFLETNSDGEPVTEEEKLSTFSRILAESGEGLSWKKDSSGKKWEVWPGNQ